MIENAVDGIMRDIEVSLLKLVHLDRGGQYGSNVVNLDDVGFFLLGLRPTISHLVHRVNRLETRVTELVARDQLFERFLKKGGQGGG